MSRHLYDLDRIMDTEYGKAAVSDKQLQETIIDHRMRFTHVNGVDYSTHAANSVNFIPPENIIDTWEQDYKAMQTSMIYGDSNKFAILIERMTELRDRLRNVK
jgi:hypothetical protein